MRFSIVIPTSNRAKKLVVLIKQLLKQTYPSGDFEILVVHNGTIDDTVSKLISINPDGHNFRWVRSSYGLSYARNRGFELASFQHVIFLDDDVRVQTDFLSSMVKAWRKHPNATLISGRILPDKKVFKKLPVDKSIALLLLKQYSWMYTYIDYGNKPKRMQINNLLCGALMSINKNKLTESNKVFDTRFGRKYFGIPIFAEDYEFCNRLVLEGKQVWFIPDVFCHHDFDPNRFKRSYVFRRQIIAGAENYLMENVLRGKYPVYKTYTKTRLLLNSFKDLCRGRYNKYLHQFKDPMSWVFFLSYYLFGPVLYWVAR